MLLLLSYLAQAINAFQCLFQLTAYVQKDIVKMDRLF